MGRGAAADIHAQGNVKPFTPVDGAAAWYARDYKNNEEWIYQLSEKDVEEVRRAVDNVKALGKDIKDVTKEEFALPTLGQKLVELRDDVVLGRGFTLIKGLPADKWPVEDVVIAYWGFSTYWGKAVSQNAKGHLIGHVKDVGLDHKNIVNRVYQTKGAQPWHCDPADFVGLLCLKTAKSGGMSSWASSVTVHNELLKSRPDDVKLWMEPWYLDRKNEVPAGKKPFYQIPVFNYYKGFLTIFFENGFFQSAQRHPEVPKLTEQQLQAIEAFEKLAGSDELRMDYWLEPGDIQLINNHQIVHTRTEYEDWGAETAQKRHLLRLWVAPQNDRELPEAFEERYGGTQIGDRGGIIIPGYVHNSVPLDAELVKLPGHELHKGEISK